MKDAQDGIKRVTDVIPLFKTCYSKGKSIIHIKKSKFEKGFASMADIIKENNLKEALFVEDNMNGFLQTKNLVESLDCKFSFGWRFNCQYEDSIFHKLVAIPKNKEGVKKLYKIFTHAFTKVSNKSGPKINGTLTVEEVNNLIDDDFLLAIPFYDSFLFNSCMNFSNAVFDISNFSDPIIFVEYNELPFDLMVRKKCFDYAKKHNIEVQETKSIFYEKESDFKAFQCFKIACNKIGGKKINISRPELSHCASNKFSFETWKNLNCT